MIWLHCSSVSCSFPPALAKAIRDDSYSSMLSMIVAMDLACRGFWTLSRKALRRRILVELVGTIRRRYTSAPLSSPTLWNVLLAWADLPKVKLSHGQSS